jgi:hypothetical protein
LGIERPSKYEVAISAPDAVYAAGCRTSRQPTRLAALLETTAVPGNPSYEVHTDGQRFLILEAGPHFTDVRIVMHWTEELKRLAPSDR